MPADDPWLKLLAAVESLAAEIRGMRQDMLSERNATKTLREQRERKASRQAKYRARNGTKTLPCNVSVASTPQVVKDLDLDLKKQVLDLKKKELKQKQPIAAVDATKTLPVTPLLEPKQSGAVWKAYSEAYRAKYKVEPVRNAKINGQITQLLKRLGADAPEVSAFYVKHNGAFYTQKGHAIGPLLNDAEKLAMEWKRGVQITATAARQQDQTQENLAGWENLRRSKDGVV